MVADKPTTDRQSQFGITINNCYIRLPIKQMAWQVPFRILYLGGPKGKNPMTTVESKLQEHINIVESSLVFTLRNHKPALASLIREGQHREANVIGKAVHAQLVILKAAANV